MEGNDEKITYPPPFLFQNESLIYSPDLPQADSQVRPNLPQADSQEIPRIHFENSLDNNEKEDSLAPFSEDGQFSRENSSSNFSAKKSNKPSKNDETPRISRLRNNELQRPNHQIGSFTSYLLLQADFDQEQRWLNFREAFREMFASEKSSEDETEDKSIEEEYMALYNQKNSSYPLILQESRGIASIFFKYRRNKQKPFHSFSFIKNLICYCSYNIMKSTLFKFINSGIIFLNLVVYIDRTLKNMSLDDFYEIMTPIFCLDIFITFCGLGPRNFIENPANFIDLFVVISLFLTLVFEDIKARSIVCFIQMPLRVFRLPMLLNLRTMSNILEGIISSVRVLGETMWFLLIFCSFYALAGLHLFSGVLKNRCFVQNTGMPTSLTQDIICGNVECDSEGSFCGKSLRNPENDSTNFDNFLSSFIEVLRVITFDSWTDLMNLAQRALTNYCSIYFISLALLGNYFLLNFFLAVLKVGFDSFQRNFKINREREEEKPLTLDIRMLKSQGIYYQKNFYCRANKGKRASFTLKDFEKTVLSFIKKNVYNFVVTQDISEDHDLKNALRKRLFSVEVNWGEKYPSGSKEDVVPLRKTFKYRKQLESVREKSRKKKLKSSFLSNFSIFRENLHQIEKKVINIATTARKLSRKPTKKMEDLKRLCEDYEKIERMQPRESISKVSHSIFRVKKQQISQETPIGKASKSLFSKLASGNESILYLNSSQNSIFPLNRFKTTKNAENHSINTIHNIQNSDSNLKLSPIKILVDRNRAEKMKNLNTSNFSNEIAKQTSFDLQSSKRSFIKNLSSRITTKRRNSLVIFPNEKALCDEASEKPKHYLNLLHQKEKHKFPNFTNRCISETSIKTQFLEKASTLRIIHHDPARMLNSRINNNPSAFIEDMKKKDYGYQRLLEKKYNINLKHGVNLNYEQAKTIVNENFDEKTVTFYDNEKKYLRIFQRDVERQKFTGSIWSGGDLEIALSLGKLKKILDALSHFETNIWRKGLEGRLIYLREFFRKMIESKIWNLFIIYLIVGYLVLLSTEGFLDDYFWNRANLGFMMFFTIEATIKLAIMGLEDYFRDSLNIIDFACQMLFIIDCVQFYIYFEISLISIFRGIYPLKMLRLMLNSPYLRAIGHILKQTLGSFIAISLLLSLIILLYALYGMQLYKEFYKDEYSFQMTNFHDITSSVGTVFLIINFAWVSCFQVLFSQGANFYTLSFYNLTLIFFGHLIVFNLFITRMLRGFETSEDEGEFGPTSKEEIKKKDSVLTEENESRKSIKAGGESGSSSVSEESDASQESKDVFASVDQSFHHSFGSSFLKLRELILRTIKSKAYKKTIKLMSLITLFSLALETYEGYEFASVTLKFILNIFFFGNLVLSGWVLGFFSKELDLLMKFFNFIEIIINVAFFISLIVPGSEEFSIIQV